jgi:hypothetical protein
VQCAVWLFSVVPKFRDFPVGCSGSLSDSEMVPVAPITTGILLLLLLLLLLLYRVVKALYYVLNIITAHNYIPVTQGDQKVSVHLIITVQNMQKHFKLFKSRTMIT